MQSVKPWMSDSAVLLYMYLEYLLILFQRNFLCHCCIAVETLLLSCFSGDVKSSRTSWPRGQNFVLGLGLGLEELSSVSASSICPLHVLDIFIFGLVKMSVMMELVIIMSLQWLSTKVIYLLPLCYWYKLVQVHVHCSIWLFRGWGGIHRLSVDSENCPRPWRCVLGLGLKGLSSFNITGFQTLTLKKPQRVLCRCRHAWTYSCYIDVVSCAFLNWVFIFSTVNRYCHNCTTCWERNDKV